MKWMGFEVRESPLVQPVPVLQLGPDIQVSPAFRQQMDAWLLEQFGKKSVAYLAQDLLGFGGPPVVVVEVGFIEKLLRAQAQWMVPVSPFPGMPTS